MKSPLHKYLPAVALSLLMLLQAGCNGGGSDNPGGDGGDDNPPPTTNAPVPTPTPVGTPDGAPASASIGVAGGTITTPDGKAKLTIPPDALAGMTTITLQPISNNAHGGLGKAFRLTPEGQTFAKPVQITFTYTDVDLVGTSAKALGIAFQQTDGLWQWVQNPVLNTANKTVTVETTHFSDWSLVSGYLLRPGVATVQTGKTVSLKLVSCYQPAAEGDDLVPLGYLCEGEDAANGIVFLNSVDEWSVNGVPGGNASIGTVTSGDEDNLATYTAPSTKPNPSTVAVSARIKMSDNSLMLLVSNITIVESADYVGTVQFDNAYASGTMQVSWKKLGEVEGVPVYKASGTLHALTHVDGCSATEINLPLIEDNDPTLGAYKLQVYPRNFGAFSKSYNFHLAGQGSDVMLQCGDDTLWFPAADLTTVVVGTLVPCPTAPVYSDTAQLAGTWSCPPALNSASWTFTAQ